MAILLLLLSIPAGCGVPRSQKPRTHSTQSALRLALVICRRYLLQLQLLRVGLLPMAPRSELLLLLVARGLLGECGFLLESLLAGVVVEIRGGVQVGTCHQLASSFLHDLNYKITLASNLTILISHGN